MSTNILRGVVVCSVLAFSACSGNPSAPTPPPPSPANIAGGWTGTVQYSSSSNTSPQLQAVVLQLTQAGDGVNGTYATQIFNGTLTGTTTPTSFSGSFTFNARTVTGAACTGSFAAAGSAGGTTMTWTSPAVSATCTGTPLNMTFSVQRR